MNEATRRFIEIHANDDVHLLALKGSKDPDVDVPLALTQIDGFQRARTKLPTWARTPGIVWPPHLALEQCSSEQTAQYKARLAGVGHRFVDLTGGFGVDFAAIAPGFIDSVYVEQQEDLCNIASKNFKTLRLQRIKTICADSTRYLQTMPPADLILIDPARRDIHGARTYSIADCTPNLLALKETLLEKAPRVMLKLSPMLDWRKAVKDIGPHQVSQVHIVSVNNECKELLLLLETNASPLQLVCANDGTTESFTQEDLQHRTSGYAPAAAGQYLYEPNASLMKAGCFAPLARRYGAQPIAPDSHLFVSARAVNFPGRRFLIENISGLNRRELGKALHGLCRANISVRHFPLGADALRQRLRLSEGGDTYIFATTQADGKHIIIFCKKEK